MHEKRQIPGESLAARYRAADRRLRNTTLDLPLQIPSFFPLTHIKPLVVPVLFLQNFVNYILTTPKQT